MKLYVDGALVGSDANAALAVLYRLPAGRRGQPEWLAEPAVIQQLYGQLDEVAFYPYVLSADQVAAHFALR